MELKFTSKEKSLESERNHLKTRAQELEKILKKNRKNESNMKEELVKINNQLNISKQAFDRQLFNLKNENETLKETLSFKTNELNNQISHLNRQSAELSSQFSTSEKEREALKVVNEKLMQQLEEFKSLKSELEQEKNSHQNAEMKIKQLEYEISSFGDWKDLSKASHTRMHGMTDLEKEVERLRHTNKNLHSSLGNKLLLEEQVNSLESRVKRYEESTVDQIGLKVQIESLEKELKDWKLLGVDYSQKGSANNPINLRTYIEKLLHRDLLLMSEKTNVSTEKSNIQGQLEDLNNVSWERFHQVIKFKNFLFTDKRFVAETNRNIGKVAEKSSVSSRQAAEKATNDYCRKRFSAPIAR